MPDSLSEIDRHLRSFRKKSMVDFLAGEAVRWRRGDVEKILPHRNPFLFVDTIERVDTEKKTIVAKRFLDSSDPIFKGHFPDAPLYPGVLQLEMMGQAALCLLYFIETGLLTPPAEMRAPNVRATKVLGAYYLAPLSPGETVTLTACVYGDIDSYFGQMVGQVISENGTVSCIACQEVCFIDA